MLERIKTHITLMSWIFGIICLFNAFLSVFTLPITAIMLVLMAILFFPLTSKLMQERFNLNVSFVSKLVLYSIIIPIVSFGIYHDTIIGDYKNALYPKVIYIDAASLKSHK